MGSKLSTLLVPRRSSTSEPTGLLTSCKSESRTPIAPHVEYPGRPSYCPFCAKFSLISCSYFKNDTLAMIGYGSQGHGQSLNARDNGINVIVGVRKDGESWKQAQEDGWVPGETLFDIPEAIGKGTIIMNLLSDAAQSATWPDIAPLITKGKTLYFSHGFSVVYKDDVR